AASVRHILPPDAVITGRSAATLHGVPLALPKTRSKWSPPGDPVVPPGRNRPVPLRGARR
ncbi:MAG TPA: hypothetical protein VE673_12710, partial [Pseudonocardiaceae bacterium]|nr:hypothetical protein [Pseudonocardiaceae bacterium]